MNAPAARAAAVRRGWQVAGLGAAVLSMGCQSYAPVTGAPPARGSEVQVVLTPAGMTQLEPALGVRVVALQGRVLGAPGAGALELNVHSTRSADGTEAAWRGEGSVLLPPNTVESISRRRVARGRTAALVGAVAVAVVSIAVTALNSGDAQGGGSAGGSPPNP